MKIYSYLGSHSLVHRFQGTTIPCPTRSGAEESGKPEGVCDGFHQERHDSEADR